MPVLQARNVVKQYRKVRALDGISIDVEAGEVFGLLGANGAGKTTFTKCITGFVRPTSGTIHLAGHDVARHPHRALRHVGIVPDEYELYGRLTAAENLHYMAGLYGLRGEERVKRVRAAMKQVDMGGRAHKKAKEFSHGMKQRTCIAQALLRDPDLVILDEPTNGLDPRGAYELRGMIRTMAQSGKTVLLNSHVMSEVEQICDRVAVVRAGKVIALDKPSQLRAAHVHQALTLIRMDNLTPAAVAAARQVAAARVVDGEVQVKGDNATVGRVVAALAGAGALIYEIEREGASLEDVFLQLTEAK